MLTMVYGYEVKWLNDPEWLPWFSYKPLARSGYDIGHGPMQFVRETIVCISTIVKINGTAQPSLVLDNLQETEKLEKAEREKAEEVIARALGSLDLGG